MRNENLILIRTSSGWVLGSSMFEVYGLQTVYSTPDLQKFIHRSPPRQVLPQFLRQTQFTTFRSFVISLP